MVIVLIISTKITTLDLLKIKIPWSKDYDVVISASYISNKILSRDSDDTVRLDMWAKFGNSSTPTKKVIITLILSEFDQRFNNLGLALGMVLKFYTSVEKALNLKVRTFLGLIPLFVEVTGRKQVGDLFAQWAFFQETADLVMFTEEIRNGKLHFLCMQCTVFILRFLRIKCKIAKAKL